MNKQLSIVMLVVALALCGCSAQSGDYIAASSISRNGFAINGPEMRKASGQEVKLWGFVDHSNLYGDEGAKAILQEWWSGEGPNTTTWRFNLKASADDNNGHSFAILIPNDPGRAALLRAFVADARAQKPTKVFVTGKLFTFDAATNAVTLTGLYMEVGSSTDIRRVERASKE